MTLTSLPARTYSSTPPSSCLCNEGSIPAGDGERSAAARSRVVLCGPGGLVRSGLRAALEGHSDMEIVAEAVDGDTALGMVADLAVDLVIIDGTTRDVDGVALTQRVRRSAGRPGDMVSVGEQPVGSLPLVMFIASEPCADALEALRAGASGLLVQSCDCAEVAYASRVVLEGGGFISPVFVRWLLDRAWGRTEARAVGGLLGTLTSREREVLDLLAEGMSNEEIGLRLYVGEPTVKYHVTHLLRKLNLRDRLQAAVYAYQHGLKNPFR